MPGGPASFQREGGSEVELDQRNEAQRSAAAGHVGKVAPRPMRGPTKARQICFELPKTKSKEQSYRQAAMEIHTHPPTE